MSPPVVVRPVPVRQHVDVDRRLAGADELSAARPLNPHAAVERQAEPRTAVGGPHVVYSLSRTVITVDIFASICHH